MGSLQLGHRLRHFKQETMVTSCDVNRLVPLYAMHSWFTTAGASPQLVHGISMVSSALAVKMSWQSWQESTLPFAEKQLKQISRPQDSHISGSRNKIESPHWTQHNVEPSSFFITCPFSSSCFFHLLPVSPGPSLWQRAPWDSIWEKSADTRATMRSSA